MLNSTEYDFCDAKQELDYILNTVNSINHVSIENAKDLKHINDRLSKIEILINEHSKNKRNTRLKRDIVFFAFFITLLIKF